MGLAAGSRFGGFEIQDLLGAGGMGEVYRARDMKLGRDVALKVISSRLTGDRERLDRFEREARALASLNHPGIAAIYGIEEADGVRALVLEFVEGETLEQRLRQQGRLPVAAALRIARQIADALNAAHDRGFVHRDLKPSNIALSPNGDVKVLDFGLAKTLFDSASPDAAATVTATEAGMILGTAAYMSPEQARGQIVDKRTDVWSFGCVLYEMVTGRAPFRGSTWSDIVSQTLTAEPDWSAVSSAVPPGAVLILKRCLEKDANRRLRGLGDIELALDAPAPPTGGRALLWIALAAAAGIGAGAAGVLALTGVRDQPAATAAAPIQFEIPLSIQPGESGAFAVSPDGKRLAFIGTGADSVLRMWERSFDAIETRPIAGTEGEVAGNSSIFWAPDSETIGFYANGSVKKIGRSGGVPQVVCNVPGIAVGGAWNERGDVVVGSPAGLMRCAADGGTPLPLTSVRETSSPTVHFFPTFLPNGQHLLYLQVSRSDPSANGLYVADLNLAPAQQNPTRVLDTGFGAEYVAGAGNAGKIVFVRSGALWAVPFLSDRMVVNGAAVQIAESIGTFRDSAFFRANASTLIYRSAVPDYRLTLRSRSGDGLGVAGAPGQFLGVALSPDETRVAVSRENRLNRSEQDLWLIDLRRDTTTRFTADAMPESIPTWSASGDALIYAAGHDAASILRKRLDGGASEILLDGTSDEVRVNPLLTTLSATGDGRFLIFSVDTRTVNRSDLWSMALQAGAKPAPLVQQDADQTQASVSRDGEWLAYVSNEAGANEVFVRRMTSDGAGGIRAAASTTLVSLRGGHAPRWRADGLELFYLSPAGQVMAAQVSPTTIGAPRELFQAPGALPSWDVSRDGQRFLLAMPNRTSEPPPFSVVVNWQSALPR